MMMKHSRTIQALLMNVCVAVCLLWPVHDVAAATLHAILAGDTLDEYIGPAVTLDIEQFRQELQTIAESTGMLVRRVELIGTQLSKSALMDTVSGLRPAADDAVLFYFSGHGFSLQSKDEWPYMALLHDEALDERWVFDTLAAAQPRLLVVLSDSCNNVIPEAYAPNISLGRQLKRSGHARWNYQALFLHARGGILASSSRHNEVSSTLKNGSAFTQQFFAALRNTVAQSRQSTWKDVMDVAVRPIQIEDQYQHPQYAAMPLASAPAQPTPTVPIPSTPTPRPRQEPTVTPTPRPRREPVFPAATPTPTFRRMPGLHVPDLQPPAPSPTPTPLPTSTPIPGWPPAEEPGFQGRGQFDCEYAETALSIELHGSENLLRFVVAADEGHTGNYKLRDRLQEYTVRLAPGKRATVYLHGERNEMLIPHDLSLCVYYEDLGLHNAVYIKE